MFFIFLYLLIFFLKIKSLKKKKYILPTSIIVQYYLNNLSTAINIQ